MIKKENGLLMTIYYYENNYDFVLSTLPRLMLVLILCLTR